MKREKGPRKAIYSFATHLIISSHFNVNRFYFASFRSKFNASCLYTIELRWRTTISEHRTIICKSYKIKRPWYEMETRGNAVLEDWRLTWNDFKKSGNECILIESDCSRTHFLFYSQFLICHIHSSESANYGFRFQNLANWELSGKMGVIFIHPKRSKLQSVQFSRLLVLLCPLDESVKCSWNEKELTKPF